MNPQEIITWLRTGTQGPSKPNREMAADCIEQLRGSLVASQARIAELSESLTMVEAERSGAEVNREDCEAECAQLRAKVAELERVAAIGRRAVKMSERLLAGDRQ